jgi:hypothetical protein
LPVVGDVAELLNVKAGVVPVAFDVAPVAENEPLGVTVKTGTPPDSSWKSGPVVGLDALLLSTNAGIVPVALLAIPVADKVPANDAAPVADTVKTFDPFAVN